MSPRSRRPALAAALTLTGLAAAAGGLLAAPGAGAATQVLHLRADAHGAMRFDHSRLSAHAGRVTLVMVNPSSSGMPHGIAVEGHGVDKDGKIVQPGGTSRVTVRLKRGTYEFYCPVRGHKAAGMEGKLVVR